MISSFRGEFFFLSNFWSSPVVYEGVTYPTVENAFQAAKTLDPEQREQFIAVTPGQAKRLGRRVALRPDWEQVKLSVMEDLVRTKFFTDDRLAYLLVATGDEELVEGNTWGDTFWGVCRGQGLNHLGQILMKIREELNNK